MPLTALSVFVKGMLSVNRDRRCVPNSQSQANSDFTLAQKGAKIFKAWSLRWWGDDKNGWNGFARENDLLAIIMGTNPFNFLHSSNPHSVANNFTYHQLRCHISKVADDVAKGRKIFFSQRFTSQHKLLHHSSPTPLCHHSCLRKPMQNIHQGDSNGTVGIDAPLPEATIGFSPRGSHFCRQND